MADVKEEVKSDEQQNYSVGNNSSDPNNLQELTQYVSKTFKFMFFLKNLE